MIHFDTRYTLPKIFDVFTFEFDSNFGNGEIDLVVHFKQSGKYWLFEIKHSDKVSDHQTKHMRNSKKIGLLNRMFGTLQARSVIYNGRTLMTEGNVIYMNADDFLRLLPDFTSMAITGDAVLRHSMPNSAKYEPNIENMLEENEKRVFRSEFFSRFRIR